MKRELPLRPTLCGTLAQMAAICRAIWVDYRETRRITRQLSRQCLLVSPPPAWHNDRCHLAVLALTAAFVLLLALGAADALQPLVDWLHRAAL